MMIRDRIQELRRIRAGDLLPNINNWRTHPEGQKSVLQDVLERIGYAGALVARECEDGTLVLIDGHLRRDMDHEQIVPVLITDLTEDEARELLAVYDPIASMAEQDDGILQDLLAKIDIEVEGPLAELLSNMESLLEPPAMEESPDEFVEFGEDIEIEYHCPGCGYEWSGKPK